MSNPSPSWSWLDTAASLFCAICLAIMVVAVVFSKNAKSPIPAPPVKKAPVFVPFDWCTPVPIMPPRRGPDNRTILIDVEILI